MKKLIFLFALVGLFGISNVNAQCSHSKAKAAKTSLNESPAAKAAAQFASTDESIEARTCSKSGTVSYYQKAIGEGGDVSYAKVVFDMDAKSFVMADAPAAAKGCSKGAKECKKGAKKCCTKGAKASTCTKAQKAACDKAGKASCTHGAKATKTSNTATCAPDCKEACCAKS